MIDTSALLASRPVDIPAAQLQAQSLANLGNQGQLQQGAIAMQPGQLEAQSQENQQRQMDIDKTQAVNAAYADASKPAAPGVNGAPGTPASLDTAKLQSALATHNAGSAIPGLMTGIMANQKMASDLVEQKQKIAATQADYAGGIGKTVKDAGYSPQLLITQAQHGLTSGAIDPSIAQPIIQELTQSLQADPTGAQAKGLAQQLADHLISASPEQQKIIAEQQASQAKADEVARQKAKDAAELPGIQATGDQKQLQNIATSLSAAKNPADYAAILGNVPQKYAQRFPAPAAWTPASSADILKAGMTPDQQVTTAQTAANATNTQNYQANELGIRRQELTIQGAHLALDQKKAAASADPLAALSPNDQAIANKLATGDLNSTQLSRMKNKEAILAGAIQINPAWSNETFNTKDSFTNPQKVQAQNLGTISRIVGHIGRFEQNSQAMGTAPLYAAGMNLTGEQNAVNNDAHAISAELEKLTSGGVGSQSQTEAWQKGLHSPSAAARQKSVDEISKLIGSQYEGMNQTYKAAIGSDLPIDKFVSPEGQAWMKAKGINVGGAAPGAAPASAPATAAPAHGIPDLGSTFNGGKVTKVTRIN